MFECACRISNPNDKEHWKTMTEIKSNILNRMNTSPPGIRICCVKFVQQVVLVQTPGVIDPRVTMPTSNTHAQLAHNIQRPDHSDISLALVPRDHPLMAYVPLEAEGHGLLDRLLDIIHGDHRSDSMALALETKLTGYSDALLVTAVLNSLGVLMHRRPIAANKILNSVLNFNPLKLANSPMTPRNKVSMRAIERTTRALLVNVLKRYAFPSYDTHVLRTHHPRNGAERPNDPSNGRIQHFLERMHRMRHDIIEEASRKRAAPVEPTDGLDPAKRQRLGADIPAPAPTPPVPAFPPGPVSYRQLYTVDPNNAAANFDVKTFQDPALVTQILIPVLQSVDERKLLEACNVCDFVCFFMLREVDFKGRESGETRSHVTVLDWNSRLYIHICYLSGPCLNPILNNY